MSQPTKEHWPQAAPETQRPELGTDDWSTVAAILAEGLVAHVGFVDAGQPFVIPMSYGLRERTLILHGSPTSRIVRVLASGAPVCVSVTLLDGLVVARSACYSSLNYRSAVLFGYGREVTDPAAKRAALDDLTDHLLPGWRLGSRAATPRELASTAVLEVTIETATAKLRTGPPRGEPPADLALPSWAGVVPLRLAADAPEPAPDVPAGVEPPACLRPYLRPAPARGDGQ